MRHRIRGEPAGRGLHRGRRDDRRARIACWRPIIGRLPAPGLQTAICSARRACTSGFPAAPRGTRPTRFRPARRPASSCWPRARIPTTAAPRWCISKRRAAAACFPPARSAGPVQPAGRRIRLADHGQRAAAIFAIIDKQILFQFAIAQFQDARTDFRICGHRRGAAEARRILQDVSLLSTAGLRVGRRRAGSGGWP